MKGCILFLILIFLFNSVSAQIDTQFGLLPKINTSAKLSKSVKWINSIEVRELVYNNEWKLSHSLIDIASIFSFKTSIDQSLNIGYLIRFRDGQVIHRMLQHYNFVNLSDDHRTAHRIGFEQEFFKDQSTRYRTRYRFTYEKPLNGNKVDLKEFYLKLGAETLYNFTTEDLEFRLLPYLGYQVTKKNKVELGIDARLNGFLNDNTASKNWLRVTWYTNF